MLFLQNFAVKARRKCAFIGLPHLLVQSFMKFAMSDKTSGDIVCSIVLYSSMPPEPLPLTRTTIGVEAVLLSGIVSVPAKTVFSGAFSILG